MFGFEIVRKERLEYLEKELSTQLVRNISLRSLLSTSEGDKRVYSLRLRETQSELDEVKKKLLDSTKGFDKDTLRKLRALVHPDKHGGKSSAEEMFKIIDEMYRRLK